jgi:phosphohistidine phosphatase
MLRLILFRHAKSDWSDSRVPDQERGLTQRGVRAARTMGEFLTAIDQVPDMALCSLARRARETVDLARRQGRWACKPQVEPSLYTFQPEDLLLAVQSLQNAPPKLLITGHEPALSGLASSLIGEARLRFPTGCMARIDLDCDEWSEVAPGGGELRWLMPPKLLTKPQITFR